MPGTLHLSRRQSLQGFAVLGAGAALGGIIQRPTQALAQDITDEDIFRFALNLEYMETEYYLRGTTGKGISAEDAGSGPERLSAAMKCRSNSIRSASSLMNWPKTSSRRFTGTNKTSSYRPHQRGLSWHRLFRLLSQDEAWSQG